MRWPWLPPSRGDIAAIALLIAICVALTFGFIKFKGWPFPNPNAGLGPDWDCSLVGKGTVCIKQVPTGPAAKAAPSN
jgi:hypothetical protein